VVALVKQPSPHGGQGLRADAGELPTLQKLALITSVLYPWALQSLEIFVTDITPGYSAGAYGAFPVRSRCQSRMRPSKE
jgi:hypothetical protein